MSNKPQWTRERKPKRRQVRAEVGKHQLREQLRSAQTERECLLEELGKALARGLVLAGELEQAEAENERLREERDHFVEVAHDANVRLRAERPRPVQPGANRRGKFPPRPMSQPVEEVTPTQTDP